MTPKVKSLFAHIAQKNQLKQAALNSLLDQATAAGYEIKTEPVPEGAGVVKTSQHLDLQLAAVRGAKALHDRQKTAGTFKPVATAKAAPPAPVAKRTYPGHLPVAAAIDAGGNSAAVRCALGQKAKPTTPAMTRADHLAAYAKIEDPAARRDYRERFAVELGLKNAFA